MTHFNPYQFSCEPFSQSYRFSFLGFSLQYLPFMYTLIINLTILSLTLSLPLTPHPLTPNSFSQLDKERASKGYPVRHPTATAATTAPASARTDSDFTDSDSDYSDYSDSDRDPSPRPFRRAMPPADMPLRDAFDGITDIKELLPKKVTREPLPHYALDRSKLDRQTAPNALISDVISGHAQSSSDYYWREGIWKDFPVPFLPLDRADFEQQYPQTTKFIETDPEHLPPPRRILTEEEEEAEARAEAEAAKLAAAEAAAKAAAEARFSDNSDDDDINADEMVNVDGTGFTKPKKQRSVASANALGSMGDHEVVMADGVELDADGKPILIDGDEDEDDEPEEPPMDPGDPWNPNREMFDHVIPHLHYQTLVHHSRQLQQQFQLDQQKQQEINFPDYIIEPPPPHIPMPQLTGIFLKPTMLSAQLAVHATGIAHRANPQLSNYLKGIVDGPQYVGTLQHYPVMARENTFRSRFLPYFRASRVVTREVLLHSLPALRDVQYQDRSSLFSRKVRLCCYQFAPNELLSTSTILQRDRDLKRAACQELAQYIHTAKPNLSDDQLSELFEMFEINLFQPLPPAWIDFYDGTTPADEENLCIEDHRWEHTQLIYDVVLKLANLTETDQRLLQKYFSPSFVLGLLDRFDSEQSRERDYLKTILHRIYGNFMQLRPFIRVAINQVFYRLIYETDRYNGTSELLEILGSIINGFALPLKEQHKVFLMRVLLPMHKISSLGTFLGQLTYCLTQFLEKDPALASYIVTAMIQYWPHISSKKELLFLKELDDVIDKIQPRYLSESAFHAIFLKLGECIASPHFQISERALMVLHSEGAFRLLAHNRTLALPPIVEALHRNTYAAGPHNPNGKEPPYLLQFLDREGPKWTPGSSTRLYGHWSVTISDVCGDVLKKFVEMDKEKCIEAHHMFESRVQSEPQLLHDRKAAWRNAYIKAEQSGLLDKYDYSTFHAGVRKIAADPPVMVRKEKKSNGPA